MDEHRPTQPLPLQSSELTERTPFCVEDRQIAEYYEGLLPEPERTRVELHVTDCRFCAARIGMLARLDEVAESHVPEDALAAAKQMVQTAPRGGVRLAAWAAAAVVVLALGVYFQPFLGQQPESGPELPTAPTAQSGNLRETRTIDTQALGPTITSPREGQSAGANSLISWTAVPSSLFYQVRIVSDGGDLLWQERVDGTEWRLPDGLELVPGAEYFVRIDAHLTEAKSLQSEYLLFRFGGGG